MKSDEVLKIYNRLKEKGINIWIDGGWCVDALLGKQTRQHQDLDIAVDRNDAAELKKFLISEGYQDEIRKDTSDFNFVVKKDDNLIDIHVFEFDESAKNIYGIEYPKDSLTGKGSINGQEVNCINPEWMFKFKTAYKPEQKDLSDVKALSEKFGFEIPNTYQI